jgi:putative serine protease PepD
MAEHTATTGTLTSPATPPPVPPAGRPSGPPTAQNPAAPTSPPGAPTPPGGAAPVPPAGGHEAPRSPSGPPAGPPLPPAGPPQPPAGPPPTAGPPPVPPLTGGPAGPPSRAPRGGRRALAALAAVALVLGGGVGGALVALQIDDDPVPRAVNSLNAAAQQGDSGSGSEPSEPLSQVAAEILPSVVSITIEVQGGEGQGSGVVLSSDGLILTNNHVASEAQNGGDMTVTFSDGSRADAEIVGLDPASDLAVIKAQDVDDLTPATLGSSADLHVGDTVLAIGSPLGLDGSVTAGIVSAVNRSITLGGSPSQDPFGGQQSGSPTAVVDAIQTDAAINPGNSGGALINADGEVVGINTAIASTAGGTSGQSGNIGVGFAIPIDDARDIADQLIDNGEATHAYLGVQVGDADDGALLGGIESGSPADEAGLQDGDVVTKVDDDQVSNATDLTAAIRAHSPGDKVTITYERDGDESTAEVTLGTLPAG